MKCYMCVCLSRFREILESKTQNCSLWLPLGYEIDGISFFFFFFNLLFLSVLGLHCRVRAFSSCGERVLLFIAVRRLLNVVASLGRCVRFRPLRWGASWVIQVRPMSSQGPYEREAGGSESGRKRDSRIRAPSDPLWKGRWPPAKESGRLLEAARKARRRILPSQPAEGGSSANTFTLGLPDFRLLTSRTVSEWICVKVGGGSLKWPKETNTEGLTCDSCSSTFRKLYT